jgi:hypothetical protein
MREEGTMGCVDRWKHFSIGLASLAWIALAAIACDDSGPPEGGGPSPSPSDASIDRADASAVDSSSYDASAEGGSFADATTDAERDDRSSQDRQPEDRAVNADTSLDGDDGATRGGDADAAFDGVGARDGDDGVDVIADTDGGCECTLADSALMGILPLECLCGGGRCLGYDVAIHECPYTPFPEDHRLDTYADCNLVIISIPNSIGIGGTTYVYDATTHELVGASFSGDFPGSPCGSTQVFGYQAGAYPPRTCALTQSVPRCVDGGDGG